MGRPVLSLERITPGGAGGRLKFVVQSSVKDGYRTTLEPMKGMFTHPPKFNWGGGVVKDLSISLDLVVDEDLGIKSSAELVSTVERLWDMALPPFGASGGAEVGLVGKKGEKAIASGAVIKNYYPPLVRLMIGSEDSHWFVRRGFVVDVDVEFCPDGYPWDSDGRPLRAKVTFTFIAHFTSSSYGVDFATMSQLPAQQWLFNSLPGHPRLPPWM